MSKQVKPGALYTVRIGSGKHGTSFSEVPCKNKTEVQGLIKYILTNEITPGTSKEVTITMNVAQCSTKLKEVKQ